MVRSTRARTKSLHAAAALLAIGVPVTLASNASADHSSVRVSYGDQPGARASVGKLSVDGRCYVIGDRWSAEREITQIFSRLGYTASFDGSRIVVYTSSFRKPRFCWESCDYDLQSSWRGDCLILYLRPISRPAPYVGIQHSVRPQYEHRGGFDSGFSISFRSGTDRGWGRAPGRDCDDCGYDRRRDQRYACDDAILTPWSCPTTAQRSWDRRGGDRSGRRR